MKKIVIILLVFSCIVFNCTAQCWQWGRRGGGAFGGTISEKEVIVGMETDARGNVYVLARLDGDLAASISSGLNKTDSVLTDRLWGGKDVILIKYDSSGKLVWYKIFGFDGTDNPYSLGMDSMGHLNIAMTTNQDFHIDQDSTAANPIRKNAGIMQYDTAGKYQWFTTPGPDTANSQVKQSRYFFNKMVTMPNGTIYQFCRFNATGLLARSNNVVIPTTGYYMLQYNSKGVAQRLIPLPIRTVNQGMGDYFFTVTKSGKFIFTIRPNFPITTDSIFINNQYMAASCNVMCFNNNGGLLWWQQGVKYGGTLSKLYLNESTGNIYACAGVVSNDVFLGTNIINTLGISSVNAVMCFDTLGNKKWLKHSVSAGAANGYENLALMSNGKIYAGASGGNSAQWDNVFIKGRSGGRVLIPSFDALTGTPIEYDSLDGNGSAGPSADLLVADKFNNLYLAGQITENVIVKNDTITSQGGTSDFFVAKYSGGCGVVPLKMTNYELRMMNEKQVLNKWQTANEINVHHFNVQRSVDGRAFENIGYVNAKNKASNEYQYIDGVGYWVLGVGKVYYRIESIDNDGAKSYSEIRQVVLGVGRWALGISVYPNPARDVVNVVCKDGIKEVRMFNTMGQVVKQIKVNSVNNYQFSIINCKLSKGVYVVQVVTANGEVFNEKVVVE